MEVGKGGINPPGDRVKLERVKLSGGGQLAICPAIAVEGFSNGIPALLEAQRNPTENVEGCHFPCFPVLKGKLGNVIATALEVENFDSGLGLDCC